jgi:hypothetical protein
MPSSVIRRFDYDEAARRLDIEFVSGKRYRYHDVPPEEVAALRAAESKGAYFTLHIRDGYRFERC